MSRVQQAAFIAAILALYALAAYLDAPPVTEHKVGRSSTLLGTPTRPGGQHA